MNGGEDTRDPGAIEAPRLFLSRVSPVGFVILVLFLIFFLYQIVGGVVTFLMIGGTVSRENVVTVRWLTMVSHILLILIPTFLLARQRHRPVSEVFPFAAPRPAEILATLIGLLALQQVLQGYMLFQEMIPLPDQLERFIAPFKQMMEEMYAVLIHSGSVSELIAVSFVVAVVPAFSEEFLFRGLIQRNLQSVSGGFLAVGLTGVIFAAYHLNPFTFVPLTILGAYFGFLTYRTGTLTLAIVAHFLNNVVACIAVYAGMDEEGVVLGSWTEQTPTAIIANTVVFLSVFAGSVWLLLRATEKPSPSETGETGE